MKYTHTTAGTRLAALSLALMLSALPLSSFAKEEGREQKGSSKKEAKTEIALKAKKGETSCLRAVGHLVAPGWIALNGTTTVSSDCWLPFGIAKKLGVSVSGTTTLDIAAPQISSVSAYPRVSDAKIRWVTDERADSRVFYATSSAALDALATSSPLIVKSSLVRDHEVSLSNLTASTTYYFKVASKDRAGNTSYSGVMTFSTKALGAQVTYPSISRISIATGTSTASVSWKTNEPSTGKVYYGTAGTVNVNSTTTSSVGNVALSTDHSLSLSGLATSTAYEVVIESKNAAGNASYSNSLTFTTGI